MCTIVDGSFSTLGWGSAARRLVVLQVQSRATSSQASKVGAMEAENRLQVLLYTLSILL